MDSKAENKRHKTKIRSNAATNKKRVDRSYLLKVVFITFFVSIMLSYLSDKALSVANILVAFIILFIFIIIGIIFDTIGIATTSGNEKPFHSMSSRNIDGALMAVKLVRNAEKVSNICNDVVGDIASIISGSAGAVLAIKITDFLPNNFLKFLVPLLITALIAATTIAGKAIGKSVAINNSNFIIYQTARLISFFVRNRGNN